MRTLLLLLLACASVSGCSLSVGAEQAPKPVTNAPAGVTITSPRICAALHVYELAAHDDFALRATIAGVAVNHYRAFGVGDCAAGVAAALSGSFDQQRWVDALFAVDSVATGSFEPPTEACARANTVLPAESFRSPLAVRTECVMYDLAFVEVLQ